MGDFVRRIRQLQRTVGSGSCVGSVERSQVYAAYQHFRTDLHHPRGGRAYYQEAVLYERHRSYLQSIADKVLDRGVDDAMSDVMEEFAGDSGEACPKELTLLAHSDHPTVTSNGSVVYNRPPEVPRMSKEVLRSLAPLRRRRRRG